MRKEATLGIVVVLVLAAGVAGYLVITNHHNNATENVSNNEPPLAIDNTSNGAINTVDNTPSTMATTTSGPADNVATTGPVTTGPTTTGPVDNGPLANGPSPIDNGSARLPVENGPVGNGATSSGGTNTGTETTYIVKSGDSLWKIAQEVYHDGTKHDLIAKANPSINPSALKVGQKLTIPPLPGSSGTGTDSTGIVHTPGAGDSAGEVYTVQSGDTLWTIAKKHYHDATKASLIETANPGIKGGQLHIGQKITLPPDTGATSRPESTSRPLHEKKPPHKTPPDVPSNRPDFG